MPVAVSGSDYAETAIFIATHSKKDIFEALCLNFELLPNFRFGLLWPSGFRQCLGAQPGLL